MISPETMTQNGSAAPDTMVRRVTAPAQAGVQPDTNTTVDQIRRVLGPDVVLLPIPRGQKSPRVKGWQTTTLQAMSDPEYVAGLNAGNIGVLLGKPSGNLCAIDIDSDELVDSFLEANPKLNETLCTRGQRGCQLWVQLPEGDDSPRSRKLETKSGQAWGEWRSDGNQSVIHGWHPAGMAYRWVVDAPAVRLTFDEIVWPEDVKLPWGDRAFRELVAEVGEPVVGNSPNPSFFAGVFRHRYPVAVHEQGLCHYATDTGLWEVLDEMQAGRKLWPFTRALLDEIEEGGLKSRLKTAAITEILNLILTEGHPLQTPANGTLIHLRNGMLDLSGCEPRLLAFAPDYGSRHRLEIDYLPGAPCPKFQAWLAATMEEEDRLLFQEWFGAVLLGPNLSQRLLLLHGDSGTGKSSLVTLVENIIGPNLAQEIRMKHLNDRFEMRDFANKTLLTGKDVKLDFLNGNNCSVLKSLTGDDRLTIEQKNDNRVESFRSRLHVVIASNEELTLRIEGDGDAWLRRLLSIRMTKSEALGEVVPGFADVIYAEEGPGVLAWGLEGARRHLQHRCRFVLTEMQEQSIQRIVDSSDGVRLFVSKKLRLDPAGGATLTMDALSRAYDEFAAEYDLTRLKKEALGRKLVPLIKSKLGLDQSHSIDTEFAGQVRGYRGLLIEHR